MLSLAPGLALRPSLRLVRPLKKGGMGEVWIGHHETLRVDVVVKFLSAHLASDEDSMSRFLREASAAARVKSPHVVQVLDQGTIDGTPFIVMELLEGEDLAERLRREERLSLADVAMVVEQVARALTAAHARGIVHRDIKPANVFLCKQETGPQLVKVLDFGVAKMAAEAQGDQPTVSGTVLGTPSFMSPEQLVGAKTVDRRTDLWALGAVAYRMLLGRAPFRGNTVGAVAVSVHGSDPPAPSSIDASLPPALDAWFERAFKRDPEARFESADAMAAAFAAAVEEVPSAAMRAARASASRPVLGEAIASDVMTPTIDAPVVHATLTDGTRSVKEAPPRGRRWTAALVAGLATAGVVGALIVAGTRSADTPGSAKASAPGAAVAQPNANAGTGASSTVPAAGGNASSNASATAAAGAEGAGAAGATAATGASATRAAAGGSAPASGATSGSALAIPPPPPHVIRRPAPRATGASSGAPTAAGPSATPAALPTPTSRDVDIR